MTHRNPDLPSRQTMAELPTRVAVFLRAAATVPRIRVRLGQAGYDEEAHQEGIELLGRVLAWDGSTGGISDDLAARDAIAAVGDFIHTHLARLSLGAARALPDEARALFGDIDGVADRQPVLALGMLLRRLERMGDSEPIVELLARRGLDRAEQARLGHLLAAAHASSDPTDDDLAAHRDARPDEHLALWSWFREWSFTARCVIKRRDLLIALGLAGRRRRVKAESAAAGNGADAGNGEADASLRAGSPDPGTAAAQGGPPPGGPTGLGS